MAQTGAAKGMLSNEFARIWIATAVLFAVSAWLAPGTLRMSSISAMLRFAAIPAIAAVGQTVVIQRRGLDMSLPGIMSLGGLAFSTFGFVTDAKGRVIGARVETPSGPVELRAAKGVVMAAGGFPQDALRRKELMPHSPSGHEHVSPAPPGNTGDGLRLGESVGATVDTSLPHSAAWVPISRPVKPDGILGTFPHFVDR